MKKVGIVIPVLPVRDVLEVVASVTSTGRKVLGEVFVEKPYSHKAGLNGVAEVEMVKVMTTQGEAYVPAG